MSRPFEHTDGLLTFPLSSPNVKQVALSLIAAGRPSARFGYARAAAYRSSGAGFRLTNARGYAHIVATS